MGSEHESGDDLADKLRGYWPSTLQELSDVLLAHFKRREGNADTPEQTSTAVVLALARHMGGRPIYLPKAERLIHALRRVAIYRAHTGNNSAALARKHGITMRAVQRIVKEQSAIARELRREGD